MSEIKEKLIGPKNVRIQILKVALLSIVLIVAFAFSTLLFNVLFGSLRNVPSTPYNEADYEDLIQTPIPIPFNLSDLLDFFQDLDINVTQEMLETLLDMYDGNFDGIPLEDLAALMGAMMFSDVEVFRVYNYTSPLADMEKYLWKYECYDQYASGTWLASVGENNYNFYTSDEYKNNPLLNPDNLTIKILNITPDAGQNQITLPTLFPTPYIMENSVNATNIDYGTLILRKQLKGLNGTALRAEFTASALSNLTYQLVGENLPSDTDINSSCVKVTNPNIEYSALLNDYLQLDGGSMANFISNHPDFATHYNYLYNNVISPGDNAFIIADKIRNYLQYNFNLSYNPVPASEADQDPINWFSKSQEGMYSDFASMFVALTRAFGVASRFVDGFNSRFVEPFLDPIEGNGFAVKYQNLYSWSEIFIPTDIYGDGYWAQIDVLFDNFMGNPAIPVFGNTSYSLNVTCNGLGQPFYPYVNRGELVNVTATLYNESTPMGGETITFTDVTSGETIGSEITNTKGEASVFVPIYDNMTVGPHVIVAQYNPQVVNIGNYVINDTIIVDLTLVDPPSINVSDPFNNTIHLQGRVYDPLNDNGVPFSIVNITLLYNITGFPVPNAFNPPSVTTDESGIFDVYLQGNPVKIYSGDYKVRADINGTYNYTVLWYGFEYNFPIPLGLPAFLLSNSSQKYDLHVDKELTGSMLFFVNNKPTNYPQPPTQSSTAIVSRGSFLGLKVVVLNETGGPVSNVAVDFFNYTGGNTIIGSNNTNQNGITTFVIFVGSSSLVGPNLIYARAGNLINYSYYILNESPDITVMSGPSPLVINKTQGDTFTITGYLNDSVNYKPLNYSDVELRIFRNSIDYTSNLKGNLNPFTVDSYGKFNVTFGVDSAIPPGNYSLRLDFNGTFDLTSLPYDVNFYIPFINTSTTLVNQLQITYEAPTILDFWINGTTTYQWESPIITRFEDLNFTTRLLLGDTPLSGKTIQFYDITQDLSIGTAITDINGYATIIKKTNSSTIAGVHLIRTQYLGYSNYSYFVLDAPINITIINGPSPNIVNCTSSYGRTFNINGSLRDSLNGAPIKYGSITVHIFSGMSELTPLTTYLNLIEGNTNLDSSGTFNLRYYVNSALAKGNYTLKVYYNGTFLYSNPNNYFNQHNFFMTGIFNFSYSADLFANLTVQDPQDVQIYLSVENFPTVYPDGFYNDGYPPQSYNRGDEIHFQIRIMQYGTWVNDTGTVYVYDDIDGGSPLASYSFTGTEIPQGFVQLNISAATTANFHSGLYRFRIQFDTFDAINKTYIIINESITITPSLSYLEIQRGIEVDQLLTATISSGFSGTIEGLRINLTLLTTNLIDITGLYLDLQGSQPITVFNNQGTFIINSILPNCPYGLYYLRIDFNGSLQDNWLFLSNSLIHKSSSLITLNVTADTYFYNCSYYTENVQDRWYQTDTLHISGTLRWDNSTGIYPANITIRIIDGTIVYENTTTTDSNGNFHLITEVGAWSDNVEIWVYYFPTDSSNLGTPEGYYVDQTSQELFRIIV